MPNNDGHIRYKEAGTGSILPVTRPSGNGIRRSSAWIFAACMSAALMMTACEKQVIETVENDTWASASPDWSEVHAFASRAAGDSDWCRSITVSGDVATVTLASGKSLVLPAGTPCLRLSDAGSLLYDSPDSEEDVDLGILLDERSTWYEAPVTGISEEGKLIVNDEATDIDSEGLVLVDCGKYVWFCLGGDAVAVPSEIHETFNPPLPRDKGLIKILFVGNSFNVDATAHLPGMLAADGTRRVLMGRVYHGGCTLPQYDDNYDAANFCSYRVCRPGESDWDGDEEYDTNLKYAVEAEDWDIVTFMEYTGNTCCWSWTEEEKGHINSLIQRVFDAHPDKRPTVMFMLTQSFAAQSDLVKTYFGSDQMEMYRTITDFAQNVLDDTCIDDVIATGTAVQNLRTSSLNDDPAQDLSRDGFHLDYGVSRYAAACTVFYNIFEPCLGLDLSDNTYRYNVKLEHSTAHSIPVTDANVEICRYAARAATERPLEITDMSSY